ncbi:NAD(P)/FAD-dependent oxidoreductase [Roseobacter weihaiensis]|uniref:NAD(P)/FAD-dependent oxidoreductase n=1 Tax=Roseobacter weihaiensis TaxID=2763262 RepID=UPI001D09CBDA|nr:NAD(P)-binding protein [Roseobacter sp. H9]
MSHLPRIAIIGAGITGLRLAQRLVAQADVDIFEKSRGFGGRMSTRRAEDFQFDHGAQYFTAHTAAFREFLTPFLADGTVARWSPELVDLTAGQASGRAWTAPRYVALPGMNALCKALAVDQKVWRSTRVAAIERVGAAWSLIALDGERYGPYDWVLCTAPAEQSAQLMPVEFAESDALNTARMQGCYSLMLGFADPLDTGWEAAVVRDSPLAWIALNNSKPGRSEATSILCQSSNDWAEAHLEDDAQAVTARLSNALAAATGLEVGRAQYVSLHKWRFAKVACPAEQPCLVDPQKGLGAAGDWCGAGRVEAGFNSADALAVAVADCL